MSYGDVTPIYVHTFDSLSELIDYADSPVTSAGHLGRASQRDESRREAWTMTPTFADAVKLARAGWSDHRDAVDNVLGNVVPQIREALPDVFQSVHNVHGATVDVAAFLAGEPECMIDFVPEPEATCGKVVTMLVSLDCSAGIDTDEIIARGAAICALAECLTMVGYTLEVWGESHSGEISHTVRVKAAADALDADAMLYAMAHPSMFRRIMFSAEEHESTEIRKRNGIYDGGGYGGKNHDWGRLTQAERLGADVVMPRNRLGLGNDGGNVFTARDTADPAGWVMRQLRKLGIIDD
jgi:hypothetical protein